jgi:uncharacterized protein YecA (UPF0149 family)
MGLVMSAYNDTVARLDAHEIDLPSTSSMEDLREWCTGFWETMSLDRDWEDDEVAWKTLGPVLLVVLESGQEDSPEVKEAVSLLDDHDIREAVYESHSHFKNCRADAIRALKAKRTVRRGPTVAGRNDPCPCGSGKKFKHCCLRRQDPTVH